MWVKILENKSGGAGLHAFRLWGNREPVTTCLTDYSVQNLSKEVVILSVKPESPSWLGNYFSHFFLHVISAQDLQGGIECSRLSRCNSSLKLCDLHPWRDPYFGSSQRLVPLPINPTQKAFEKMQNFSALSSFYVNDKMHLSSHGLHKFGSDHHLLTQHDWEKMQLFTQKERVICKIFSWWRGKNNLNINRMQRYNSFDIMASVCCFAGIPM